jgi:hypothetical protein
MLSREARPTARLSNAGAFVIGRKTELATRVSAIAVKVLLFSNREKLVGEGFL